MLTKCIKRIRDLFEYALYEFTLYLLTYLLTYHCQQKQVVSKHEYLQINVSRTREKASNAVTYKYLGREIYLHDNFRTAWFNEYRYWIE